MAGKRPPPDTLPPIRSSAAIREYVQARLEREVEALHRSIVYWLTAQWRRDTPPTVSDASPVNEMLRLLQKRDRLWRGKFAAMAGKLAVEMTRRCQRHVDRALAAMLRDRGLAIRFRLSRSLNATMQASVGAQVSLISGLANNHLQQVEGAVMRAIQTGHDVQSLTADLQNTLGVTRRRAAFIARDQTSKATATIARTRTMELGCTEAFWLHSAGGKTPRPEHVAFSGKRYSLKEGAFLEGKWTHPGVEINCRCVSRPILPSLTLKEPVVRASDAWHEEDHPRDDDGEFVEAGGGGEAEGNRQPEMNRSGSTGDPAVTTRPAER